MNPQELLAAVRGERAVEWPAFTAAALPHGLGPRLALLPGAPVSLQRHRSGVLAQNLLRQKALAAAAEALAPLPVILLKGAAYLVDLIEDPSLRPMSDVDVLIRAEDVPGAVERLAPLGYTPSWPAGRAAHDRAHHELVLAHAGGSIDLHQAFVQRARTRIDYHALWSRRRPAPGWPAHVSLLAREDAFVYHCLHQAVHEYDLPLQSFVDLALMVERWTLDPAAVRHRAEEWAVGRALWCSMRILAALWPAAKRFAESALPSLAWPARALLDRLVIRRALETPPARRRPRLAQLATKAALLEPRERLRFLAAHTRAVLRPRPG